ncbi:MAG: ATP-binding protein [Bdellovibrionales bacterium]
MFYPARLISRFLLFLRSFSSPELLACAIACAFLGLFPLDAFAASQNQSIVVPLSLAANPLADVAVERTPDLVFGIFLGVMFTASLYLFFIWVVIHDRGQVFLILLLLCLGINMAVTNDAIPRLLGLAQSSQLGWMQNYSLLLAYFFGLIFTYHFLEIDTNAPFMKAPILLACILDLLTLVLLTFSQDYLNFLIPIISVLSIAVILFSGLGALYNGASGSLSHITAFLAFLVGTVAMPLYDLGVLLYEQSAQNLVYLGFSIAAMMFAIVIAVQFATRQEEKEKALEISNERFSLAAKGSNEGLFDWQYKTDKLYISDQLRHILHLTRDTTPKTFRGWMRLIHPQDRRIVKKALHKLLDSKGTSSLSFEVRVQQGDKHVCWIHTKMVAVQSRNRQTIERLVGSIGDVTQRKHSEVELRASEVRFRSITEAHPVPVMIATVQDNAILYASPGAEQLLGLPPAMLTSHTLDRFIARANEREEILNIIRDKHDVDMKEVTLTRWDGELLPVALSARPITYRNQEAMVVGLYDLTESKKAAAQIAQQQEALQQSEKMAALGGLLAGVAHELNNPLSVVMGQTTLLIEGQQEEKIVRRAEKIFKAADRCSRIVKSFLALARRKPPEHKSADLNSILNGSLELLGYQFRNENVELTLELDPNLPAVIADADQMTQVFTNIALNAAQALHEWEGPHKLTIRSTYLADSQQVQFSFMDTGPGIPEDLRKRVFEPFFTTKGGLGGTGVGLALCANIISGHSGLLAIEETPGGGATFIVTLPAAQTQETRKAETGTTPEEEKNEKLRLLLVDDEVELAQTLADLLEPDGHDIDLAINGKVALEKLQKSPFDIIISDLRMPVLDGPGMYAQMARSMPQYLNKIIYVTGDTLSPHVNAFLKETPVPVIEKPYRLKDVRQAISDLLKGQGIRSTLDHDSPPPSPPVAN